MRRAAGIQRAFDEARFGPSRTLNLRDSLPSGAEAVRRAELWLRGKQVELSGEVLVITGRGNQSVGQVAVVREEVRKLFGVLRRRGVIADAHEHNPGAFIVRLAPMRSLFAAASSAGIAEPARADPTALAGLSERTRTRLRLLATYSLDALGIRASSERFTEREMLRHFALLSDGLPHTGDREQLLAAAIDRAIAEYDDLAH